MNMNEKDIDHLTRKLRAYFPIVLTIASGISCFFLFTQLDNWLKREEIRRQNTSK